MKIPIPDKISLFATLPGLSYFCELSLHTKFQLPRFCLSCISMVEDGEEKRRKESAVLMATLATAQVELSLS